MLFLYLAIWLLTLYINERELNSIELKIIQYIFVFLLILQRLKYTVGRMWAVESVFYTLFPSLNWLFRNVLYNVYLYISLVLSLLYILDVRSSYKLPDDLGNTYGICGYYKSVSQYSSFFSPAET